MIYEFYTSILFIFVVGFISYLLIFLNMFLVEEQKDFNKSSTYECGFQPIDLNLQQFDIKFYIVGLLFLLFDIEIMFLLPFLNVITFTNYYGMFVFIVFMLNFLITFLYEWKNNFLDWN